MSHPESIARRLEAGGRPSEIPGRIAMQIKRFTGAIFEPDDLVEIRPLPGGDQRWVRASELAGLASELAEENLAGRNIYFGANPRQHKGGCTEDVARKKAAVAVARKILVWCWAMLRDGTLWRDPSLKPA